MDRKDTILNLLANAKTERDWIRAASWIRGICHEEAEVACTRCRGRGNFVYGNGSTWRGGMGTASCTEDVCDLCWGTGRNDITGVDLRELTNHASTLENEHGREASSKWLASRLGIEFSSVKKMIPPLAKRLTNLKGLDFWNVQLLSRLSDALLEMAGMKEDKQNE